MAAPGNEYIFQRFLISFRVKHNRWSPNIGSQGHAWTPCPYIWPIWHHMEHSPYSQRVSVSDLLTVPPSHKVYCLLRVFVFIVPSALHGLPLDIPPVWLFQNFPQKCLSRSEDPLNTPLKFHPLSTNFHPLPSPLHLLCLTSLYKPHHLWPNICSIYSFICLVSSQLKSELHEREIFDFSSLLYMQRLG